MSAQFKLSSVPDASREGFCGLDVPRQFYQVLDRPAPLAGMQLPQVKVKTWSSLYENGFRWIACLCSERPVYDPYPLRWLCAVELCDLIESDFPDDPEDEESKIHEISSSIVERLFDSEGVIVHCAGGRGRTGSVLGIVLTLLGFTAGESIEFLDHVHKARGKFGWPEALWQKNIVERNRPHSL